MGRSAALVTALAIWLCFCCCCFSWKVSAAGEAVTYDGRSLFINGTRRILFSGSIHYPRSTPQMWSSLINKAKLGGLDVIQTYVFWNVHEPVQGQYNFEGRYDLVRFIKEIQAQGLYCSLRIGPFIESEWNYGGFPFWLHDVPGIIFRTDNEPFKFHMQRWTSKIVSMLKAEGLYASQGGPIILSQIENEYGNIQAAFRDKAKIYIKWAASMAVGLDTGVPWMMCKQMDAPDPVINSCNGMNCGETFQGPNSPTKPALWTENWTSNYQVYGHEPYMRSVEDIAFAVTLFIAAKSGSFVNYYMYHGGTNFGRFASAFVITGYYDQAPLDEYGLLRQPKYGHLRELHSVIKQCSDTILFGTYSNASLGTLQEAHTFVTASGQCVAFLVNRDPRNMANIQFRNTTYQLPKRSISILPDCKTVAFNTRQVSIPDNQRTYKIVENISSAERWQAYMEEISHGGDFSANSLLEQLGTTKDTTDYLWYSTRYNSESGSDEALLHIDARSHVVHAFVNDVYLGNSLISNGTTSLDKAIKLQGGSNNISVLGVMVGLPDSGAYLEHKTAGLLKVTVTSNGDNPQDLTNNGWTYQISLGGEKLKIYTEGGSNNVTWGNVQSTSNKPLMWYKTSFDAPSGNDPMVLNLASMGKGEAWVNGQSIGRYWITLTTPKGQPSQSLYHVPLSFLKPSGNLLVLFEEMGGDPLGISVETVSVT